MGKKAKKDFYAVARGRQPGVFRTWPEAEGQVKGFSGARHMAFSTMQQAEDWLASQAGIAGSPRAPAQHGVGGEIALAARPISFSKFEGGSSGEVEAGPDSIQRPPGNHSGSAAHSLDAAQVQVDCYDSAAQQRASSWLPNGVPIPQDLHSGPLSATDQGWVRGGHLEDPARDVHENSGVSNSAPPGASGSLLVNAGGSLDARQGKRVCRYGAACYRKNPQHKADFWHPPPATPASAVPAAAPATPPAPAPAAVPYLIDIEEDIGMPFSSQDATQPRDTPSPSIAPPVKRRRLSPPEAPEIERQQEPKGAGVGPGVEEGLVEMRQQNECNGGVVEPDGQGIAEPLRTEGGAGKRGLIGLDGVDGANLEQLNPMQQKVFEACMARDGKNVFFTGMGGTGKTFLLKRIIAELKSRHGSHAVVACAPTGVAALLCNGTTLHALAGCGIVGMVGDFEKMWTKQTKRRLREMQVMIIDEVSMVEASFLDWLDSMLRKIKKCPNEAMGGAKLIVCGDFCQLPGIVRGLSLRHDRPQKSYGVENIPVGKLTALLAAPFQTNMWREARFSYFELVIPHRQKDTEFIEILTELRRGNVGEREREFMVRLARPLSEEDGVKPTTLYSHNVNVDHMNNSELAKLPLPAQNYEAVDSVHVMPGGPRWASDKLWQSDFFQKAITPKSLSLRNGAQVMLTMNDRVNKKLVNGSRGVVTGFVLQEDYEDELLEGLGEMYGMSMEDMRKAWEDECEGQRSPPPPRDMSAMEMELRKELEIVHGQQKNTQFPIVQYTCGERKVAAPVAFEYDVYMMGKCRRIQVPLRLAWALTIHKCQGSTLDKVTVNLGGCFAEGQAYVSLSRASSPAGLQVQGFRPETVMANPVALQFHDALSGRSATSVEEFVGGVDLWWAPLFKEKQTNAKLWKDLHLKSDVFKEWVARHKPEYLAAGNDTEGREGVPND